MDKQLETIFLDYLRSELNACFEAWSNLQISSPSDPFAAFTNVESFVTHAAAVSRIFWPATKDKALRQRADQRSAHLRSLLGIPARGQGHSVEKHELRDHLEHYDERLDSWHNESPNKIIIGRIYGDSTGLIAGHDPKDVIEEYDPATKIFKFRGEPYQLQEMYDGLKDIEGRMQQCVAGQTKRSNP